MGQIGRKLWDDAIERSETSSNNIYFQLLQRIKQFPYWLAYNTITRAARDMATSTWLNHVTTWLDVTTGGTCDEVIRPETRSLQLATIPKCVECRIDLKDKKPEPRSESGDSSGWRIDLQPSPEGITIARAVRHGHRFGKIGPNRTNLCLFMNMISCQY